MESIYTLQRWRYYLLCQLNDLPDLHICLYKFKGKRKTVQYLVVQRLKDLSDIEYVTSKAKRELGNDGSSNGETDQCPRDVLMKLWWSIDEFHRTCSERVTDGDDQYISTIQRCQQSQKNHSDERTTEINHFTKNYVLTRIFTIQNRRKMKHKPHVQLKIRFTNNNLRRIGSRQNYTNVWKGTLGVESSHT